MKGAREQGFSLITILLMTVVLATLALGALNTSILQERMAGNSRDANIALQSAEAALRDAEADILASINTASPFMATCDNGLCVPPSMSAGDARSQPAWQGVTWDSGHTRRYGQYTGAAALPTVAVQPLYIIELLPDLPPGIGNSVNLGTQSSQQPQVYRITARATGRNPATSVMLQSVFVKQ
ncbi:MAG: PilX N-terminal domain-containing pilus assembly protein [Pseudomonadota bacterium]|nr:PilX N-terminal domain-containing pilus assembly protein [Pseudomonadota bacterium]